MKRKTFVVESLRYRITYLGEDMVEVESPQATWTLPIDNWLHHSADRLRIHGAAAIEVRKFVLEIKESDEGAGLARSGEL
tara:strand:+ start:5759 stop:5998 length:240 start_codon:yes stop_codon:yes gene_type:complete